MTTATRPAGRQDELRTFSVEQRGIEPIPREAKHGRPRELAWLWAAANIEFATVATGVLPGRLFGLAFGQAVLAIIVGNLLGALLLGWFSTYGVRFSLPQLMQSRSSFGIFGNSLPGLLNFVAGCSWFAVNTILGVFALERLAHWTLLECAIPLVAIQTLIAVYGHNMIKKVEARLWLVLAVIFGVVTVYAITRGHLSTPFNAKTAGASGFSGAFIDSVAIALAYMLGWLMFASDYTRYLPKTPSSKKRVFWCVFSSSFLSCVWLEIVGAALGTLAFVSSPTDLMAGILPHTVAIIALWGVIVGTITANVLNLYSGSLSVKVIPGLDRVPRWIVAAVAGVIGGFLTYYLGKNGFYLNYETFLFLLAYAILPWAAIVLVDVSSGRANVDRMYYHPSKLGAGLVCWLIAIGVSTLFMDQPSGTFVHYVGPIAAAHPGLGDITYYAGFVLAALLYFPVCRYAKRHRAVA